MAAPSPAPLMAAATEQLDQARKVALNDPAHYEQLIPTLLPFVGPSAVLQLRRWGTDFLAEAFSNPGLSSDIKTAASLKILTTLRAYLESATEDAAVVRNVVQIATSVYPLIFKHV